MKKLTLAACALALFGCSSGVRVKTHDQPAVAGAELRGGPKRRIGVAAFEDRSNYGQGQVGLAASDILVTELAKSGRFVVVEREKLDKVLAEQKLQAQGFTDQRTAAKLGQLMGLEVVVAGSVSQFGVKEGGTELLVAQSKTQTAEAAVDIRLIDVQSGQVLLADSGKGSAASRKSSFLGMGAKGGYDETLEGEALRAAIVKFVSNIAAQLENLPWSCSVAAVTGGAVYLNAGPGSGLKTGARLECFRPGEEITDQATGKIIGRAEQPLGSIEIAGPCGAGGDCSRAGPAAPAGTPLKPGDICRLP